MSPTESVAAFRSEYGKLCQMAAEALAKGVPLDTVRRGAAGHTVPAFGHALHVGRLRTQRQKANAAMDAAKATGASITLVILAGLEVKAAVEGEWMRKLPMRSEAV